MKYPSGLTQEEYVANICLKFSQDIESLKGSLIEKVIKTIARVIRGTSESIIEEKILKLTQDFEKMKGLDLESETSIEERLRLNLRYGDCFEFSTASVDSLHRIIDTHNQYCEEEIPYPKGEELKKLCELQKDVFELCSSEIFMANSQKFAQEFAKKQEEDQQKAPSNVTNFSPKAPGNSVTLRGVDSLKEEQSQRSASM